MNSIKILFLCFFCSIASAQTSISGGSFTGGEVNGIPGIPIQLGAKAWWGYNRGFILNGTNVQSWIDLTDNHYNLAQYNTTNQPSYYSGYTTNNLTGVYFGANPPTHLKCDAVAPQFSGEDRPFTIIALVVGQTNGNTCMPISFGWGSASNNNASKKGISINRPGSTVVSGAFLVADTNSAAIAGLAYVQSFPGFTTNRAFIYTAVYDGQNGRLYNNLQAGTNNFFDTGPITVNQLTVGLSRGTNGSFAAGTAGSVHRGFIGEIQLYDYALPGAEVTNAVNDVNRRIPVRVY